MNRVVVLFYLLAGLWLAGFGLAAVTDAAPWTVVCGTCGLLGFAATVAARLATGDHAGT